jgi:hypothetical protein
MPEQNGDERELAEAVRDILADVRKQPSTGTSMRPVPRPDESQQDGKDGRAGTHRAR